MTINDLLARIHSAQSDSIGLERLAVRTGNTDGSGNYSIIKLNIDGHVIEFNNSTGTWVAA